MPYASLGDLQLYYEEFGRGETVLFLHSHFSRGLLAFGAQIQPFQGQYRCLFPDLRGHGRTICSDLTWDSRRAADDLPAFLDALGVDHAHIVGYSFGCSVGLYFAAKYPQRVLSLCCIGASNEPVPDGSEEFLPERLIAAGDWDTIETMNARHFDAHQGNWQEYLRQTVRDWRTHPSLTEEEWRAVCCPVFFINGEHDPFGNVRALQAKCPHAQVYEVPGGSHRPHFAMDQAKEINETILAFLSVH